MIEFKNLSLNLDNQQILDKINLIIPQKQCVGIIGPNGAGKTTLLKSLISSKEPYQGDISIDGNPIQNIKTHEFAKFISWVPESCDLPFSFRVIDIVLMGRFPTHSGNPSHKDIEDTKQLLERVELSHKINQKITSLSTGERKRVLVARALLSNSNTLIFDEPVANLDIHAGFKMLKILKDESIDRSIILSIHDINLANKFCDYIIMMKDGKIYSSGITKDVLTLQNIKSVFNIETEIYKNHILFMQT